MADEVTKRLEDAQRRYDASGVPLPPPIGSVVSHLRLVRGPEDEPREETDPIAIADARRALWRRIPEFCRRHPDDLLLRARDPRIVAAAESWDWGSPCLVMCGPTQAAKTSAAAAILVRLMARGRESEYRRWSRIRWFGASQLTNLARSWPLGSGECPELRQAATCDLLVLDDLGNETDWQSTLFDVLQTRYERQLPLIATTGLPPDRLLERYGDAILRRLAQRHGEMGTIVNCWVKP